MRILSATFLTMLIAAFATPVLCAEREWETTTPYYEDDAWYDVSEWFDGNDYNPTDEEFGEWDDEIYQYDPDSTDTDNDWNFGYDRTADNDDWFYDYYDDGAYTVNDYESGDDLYDFGSRYYDFDGNGVYDAYAELVRLGQRWLVRRLQLLLVQRYRYGGPAAGSGKADANRVEEATDYRPDQEAKTRQDSWQKALGGDPRSPG